MATVAETPKQAKRRRQRESRERKKEGRQAILGGDRVLLRKPFKPVDLPASAAESERVMDAFWEKVERERSRTIHPVVRLADDGVDWGATPLPGDEIGYGMNPYRGDDCLLAAIATATQIPIEEVPDPRLHDRLDAGEEQDEINRTTWSLIEDWAASRELALKFWTDLPAPRERWIGISGCEAAEDGDPFNDHCLVMCHDRVLFNPIVSVMPLPGTELLHNTPGSLKYGISFEKEE